MSKPYTFGESTYLTLEPTNSRHEEESGFETMNDFNNQHSAKGARYSTLDYSSVVNLSEQVPKLELSQQDWKAGESQAELYQSRKLKKVTRATDQKRKEVIDYMAKGNRWRYFIFWVFGGLVTLGIVLYFVIPRVPSLSFPATTSPPLTSTDLFPFVSSNPATFNFTANLTLQLDARSSYVPVTFSILTVQIAEQSTGAIVGTGNLNKLGVKGGYLGLIVVPMLFKPANGAYVNSTDPTYGIIREACGPIFPTSNRPTLSLALIVSMAINGVIGTTSSATQITNIVCPVQFSATAS